jgi:hypothetical protein
MTMTNENVVENIDEIVMRLREIRRDAEDNGGAAYPLGRLGIEATTRAIVDMLALRENFQIQIEAEAESSPEAADEPEAETKCNSKNPEDGYGDMGCVCEREAGHAGYCFCEYLHEWQMPHETEAPLPPETETPPVKVGDTVVITAKQSFHHFTIGEHVTVSNVRQDGVVTACGADGTTWTLNAVDYEIVSETQPTPKPEGITVAELIGKLQNAPNQNAIAYVSAMDATSQPLKQIGCHFDDDPNIYLRDYIGSSDSAL